MRRFLPYRHRAYRPRGCASGSGPGVQRDSRTARCLAAVLRRAVGTQQIALLVPAGRQPGGWEEWTPIERIREVCRDYGRFDVATFASTVKRMGDLFSFRGRARQLELRLTRPGFEQAGELACELSGV